MNPALIQDFVQLIASHTGMQIQDRDRVELVKKIGMRMTAQKLTTPEAYYQLLATPPIQGSKDEIDRERFRAQEWQALTLLLTTGETYFFRDRGQLNLIQETILPEIIARKMQGQALSQTKPSLRIWSAGCSTGEEPYSLATIVQELIPNYLNWNLLILGTDINTESIAKAKAGSYSEWSFRMVSGEIKRRYFSYRDKSWQLDNRIRRMVAFRTGNLLADDYPSLNSDIYNMDIIICRNVFIYFNAENVETILGKFYQSLSPVGYLIVGHTELHDLNLQGFVPKAYEESVVYQRSEDVQNKQATSINQQTFPSRSLKPPTSFKPASRTQKTSRNLVIAPQTHSPERAITAKTSLPPAISNSREKSIPPSDLTEVQALFDNGNYQLAVQQAEQIWKQQPENLEVVYLIARAFANLGNYTQAIYYCQEALKIDALSLDPYYLLAHIAEEQGKTEKAKDFLKRIIYLSPSSIPAYLELGSIYEGEGNKNRAVKMRTVALDLLEDLPPYTIVEYQGKIVVGDLILYVKKLLASMSD